MHSSHMFFLVCVKVDDFAVALKTQGWVTFLLLLLMQNLRLSAVFASVLFYVLFQKKKSQNTSYLVFMTVTGIRMVPAIVRAVIPIAIDCTGVGLTNSNVFLSHCRVEKYRPTPGTTLVIDLEKTLFVMLRLKIR